MNFKKSFHLAAAVALAVIGATGCGGGGSTTVSHSSHAPGWSHHGRTGYYVIVTGCTSYNSLACYCDSYGCWYDNSGWYDIGGGYYTGYWPGDTSYTGNSSNSGGYYNNGSTSDYGNSSNSYNPFDPSNYYSGNSNTSNTGDSSNSGHGYSTAGQTKDVDLQNADLQKQDLHEKAQKVASQFQMDFNAAMQLTQLADKFDKLSISGKMTDADRAAIIDSTLGVAGISTADVNKAIQSQMDGNKQALDELLEQGAKNLGMPNSAGLRDQILPQLGIKL